MGAGRRGCVHAAEGSTAGGSSCFVLLESKDTFKPFPLLEWRGSGRQFHKMYHVELLRKAIPKNDFVRGELIFAISSSFFSPFISQGEANL